MGRLLQPHRDDTGWHTDPGFNEYDHHEVLVRHRPDFEDPEEVIRFLSASQNAKHAFQAIFEVAMARWMGGQHDADYRESWPAFQARCVGALQRMLDGADKSQSVIVFTSGGTIAVICQHLLGLSDKKMAELNWSLVNSGVTKLLYRPDRVSLSYVNSFAHLEWRGRTDAITYR
jgi:broad specificity phosphatase PhoE